MSSTTMKPQGAWEVCRGLPVPGLSPADATRLQDLLGELPGVLAVEVAAGRAAVRVRYDITRTDYATLCHAVAAGGFPTARSWWQRRRADWLQNLDLTGRDNAAAKPAACCNQPPVAKGGRDS